MCVFPGEAVPILGEHHRDATSGHNVPHARSIPGRSKDAPLAGVLHFFQDLVTFVCCVLPQRFDLLGKRIAACCLLVGEKRA
jgi:hypothetical protein